MFEKFQALELKYDVEKIKVNGIQVWPMLRIYLADLVLFEKGTSVKPDKKIYFASLKYFFYGFSNFFKSIDHLYFSSSDQRKKIGSKYIDRADIVSGLIKKTLIVELPSSSKHYSKNDIPKTPVASKFPFYGITWLLAKFQKDVLIEEESVLKNFMDEAEIELDYQWNLKLFFSQIQWMKFLIKWKKIKTLLLITPYTNMGYVYAAKSLGLPVIEFQHGTLNPSHYAYNINKPYDRNFYPDALLTFGLKEKNTFNNENFYIQKEQVFPVGSFVIDRIIQNAPKDDEFSKLTQSYKRVVAFSALDAFEELYIPFLKEISENTPETAFILMPRHRSKEYYLKFDFSKNVLFFGGLSTYEIMYLSDIHSTIHSTTVSEAAALGKPNLLLNIENKARLYWEQNIDSEICFYADSPQQYLDILKNFPEMESNLIMEKNKEVIISGFEKNIAAILPNYYLKHMLKSAGIYTVANMLNAAVPFLLLPILTMYLSPAEYAIVTLFQVMMNGVLPFTGFNLEGAISRQYFDRNESNFPSYVSNGFYILLSSSLIMLILFEVSSKQLETWTDFPANWMWAVVCFAFFQKVAEVLLTIWRVEDKPIQFGVFRLLRTSLDLGLSMYFIIILKRSWEGRIEGQLVAIAFFALIALFYLIKGKHFSWGYHKGYVRSILKFGLPLIPHVIGAVIITYSDRLFITNMIGLTEMGLYSVGYQIGMVISLMQSSFNQAWQPWLYQKLKDNNFNDKRRIVKITYIYFAGLILAVLALTFIGPWIVEYMTADEYKDANQFIFWIALGFAFNGMYKMVGNYLFYLRKTMTIGIITAVTALINIALNYIFIKMNGSVGAAQSTAITFFIQFVVVWFISAKYFKMPWLIFNQTDDLGK